MASGNEGEAWERRKNFKKVKPAPEPHPRPAPLSRCAEIDGRHELRRGHELEVQAEVDEAASEVRARLEESRTRSATSSKKVSKSAEEQ